MPVTKERMHSQTLCCRGVHSGGVVGCIGVLVWSAELLEELVEFFVVLLADGELAMLA